MTVVWAMLLIVAVLAFWFVNLLGLPGNWLIVATAALYTWLMPVESRLALGWPIVGLVAGLAVLGELVELAGSAAGVRKVGGSKRGALLALVGSVVGAMVGMFVGIPIPFVGSLFAALLFGGLGALLGAMLGESWKGRSFDQSWQVGQAAFWARMIGALAKVMIGAVMVGVVIAGMFF